MCWLARAKNCAHGPGADRAQGLEQPLDHGAEQLVGLQVQRRPRQAGVARGRACCHTASAAGRRRGPAGPGRSARRASPRPARPGSAARRRWCDSRPSRRPQGTVPASTGVIVRPVIVRPRSGRVAGEESDRRDRPGLPASGRWEAPGGVTTSAGRIPAGPLRSSSHRPLTCPRESSGAPAVLRWDARPRVVPRPCLVRRRVRSGEGPCGAPARRDETGHPRRSPCRTMP